MARGTHLTSDEAERILEILGTEIFRDDEGVSGIIWIDEMRVLYPSFRDDGSGAFPGNTGNQFRRLLHLEFDEFERLKQGEMEREEFLRLVTPRIPEE